MIVRGAVLSEKRVTLEGALPERPSVAPIRAVPSASQEGPTTLESAPAVPAPAMPAPAVAAALATVASPISPTLTAAPSLAPAPRPISFEAVATWLATQSEATRAKLAGLLTDDIERIQSAAREKGWQEGHDEGRVAAQAESESVLSVLARINEGAQTALEQESATLADQCAEVVAVALARIAGAKLVSQKAALGVVGEILKRVTDERELIVRVSAADLPALQDQKEKLDAAVAGRSLTLVADPRVQLGGAIVESKLGSLDGRLEVQLRALFETLQAAKSSPREAS